MNDDNKLTRHAVAKLLKGEELRAAQVRVVIDSIRPPTDMAAKPSAGVTFQTVDIHGEVLSTFGQLHIVEGDSVTIAEIDRIFTFTIS